MSNEYQPQFGHDLAKGTEVEYGKIDIFNNPSKSLDEGLITLYKKYLARIDRQREAGLIDREKANELAKSVLSLVERDGLRNEIGFTSTEKAQEIMGAVSYFGPNEVMKAGIEIREEISPIPFNPEELERGNELGQMLIYRTSTTMKELDDTFSPILETQNKGRVIGDLSWHKDENFYTSEKIQPGWALVSRRLTPGSTGKYYLEQSVLLAEYLVNEVYQGIPLARGYQEAIDQLKSQKESILKLTESRDKFEWLVGLHMLADLKINQLFRQSPAEVIYDGLVFFQNTGEKLHKRDSVWTNAQLTGGSMVEVGHFDEDGAVVSHPKPFVFTRHLGVSFARRGADLKL